MTTFFHLNPRHICLFFFFTIAVLPLARAQNHAKNRTIDGTLNNLNYPSFGTTYIPFFREIPSEYADGKNKLAGPSRPTPRLISNKLSDEPEDIHNERDMAGLFYIWGLRLFHCPLMSINFQTQFLSSVRLYIRVRAAQALGNRRM
jgi:hypothetical protein